jgi:hypothetical protein
MFLNGKMRVTLALKIGLVSDMFFAIEFWRSEIFIPIVTGLPGNDLFKFMSELKLLLKYWGLIGSKLFFVLLSEIKLTLDENAQYGFDFASFL